VGSVGGLAKEREHRSNLNNHTNLIILVSYYNFSGSPILFKDIPMDGGSSLLPTFGLRARLHFYHGQKMK
jgi:hypothetical protein